MNIRLLLIGVFVAFSLGVKAQICSGNGNLMLYTNYDGGIININVDVNIPNLKIGICTYEPVQVNISGAFVNNVTQVLYAGFNSTQNNNNCNQGNFITSISGVPQNIFDIRTYPPVDLQNPNGWPNIICAYSCDTIGNQGGCNTVDQVVYYFTQQTGGTLYAHNIQYNCWLNTTYNVSAGGTCCITAGGTQGPPPVAAFTSNTDTICEGDCVSYFNNSTDATTFQWSFTGATPSSSTDVNPTFVCYTIPGTYPVSLIATGANGSDTITTANYVYVRPTTIQAGFTYEQIDNYTVQFTNTTTGADSYTWTFPGGSSSPDAAPSFDFPSDGDYWVVLQASNICGTEEVDSILVTVIKMSVGINEDAVFKSIAVYPNPAQNSLFVKTVLPLNYTVYDVVGKQLLSGNTTGAQPISIDRLSKGMYFISFTSKGKQAIIKFVKE